MKIHHTLVKEDKIKGDNLKIKKEQQAGEDTRDKNKKTMTGQVATSLK